jgi:hypothetical protein
LPLYEGKFIHQFDHRWATYNESGVVVDVTDAQKQNPEFTIRPRYWINESDIEKRLTAVLINDYSFDEGKEPEWLMGWRDITNVTNERTTIVSIVPIVATNHKFPLFVFPHDLNTYLITCFYANLNSLVFDYVARQKIGGTDLTYTYLKQLPVLPPNRYTESDIAFIVPRVLELTYTANDMRPFYDDVVNSLPEKIRSCGSWLNLSSPYIFDPDRRAILRSELDAWYARLYGLTRDELRYILDPADVMGADYPSETFRVLKEKEIAAYGEYRTRRLVLEAWDAQEAARNADNINGGAA